MNATVLGEKIIKASRCHKTPYGASEKICKRIPVLQNMLYIRTVLWEKKYKGIHIVQSTFQSRMGGAGMGRMIVLKRGDSL